MDVISRASQDYLKVIYALSTSGRPVTNGALAHELGVSPPSVSAMVRRLTDDQLLDRPASRVLRLTELGESAAVRVVRRHRLLETFLAQIVHLPWDEVHAEAELLEHALSQRLEGHIDALLGHPSHDPHGDPIPPRDGRHDEAWGEALEDAPAGSRFQVDRVCDRDSAALRYFGELGIVPGVILDVEEQIPFSGPRWIRIGDNRHALGRPLTALVHGRVLADSVCTPGNLDGANLDCA